MATNDNGGPAFPAPEAGFHDFNDTGVYRGMTLRDYFAAKAIQGLMARPGAPDPTYESRLAYQVADAMLKERSK
jgi:hypothetical protein